MAGIVGIKISTLKTKGLSVGLFVMLFSVIFGGILPAQTAEAFGGYVWANRPFNSSTSHAYFENKWIDTFFEEWGQPAHVIHDGVPYNITTPDQFVDFLYGHYTSPNLSSSSQMIREKAKSSRVGAAFIVYTMLGYNGDQANAAYGRYNVPKSLFDDVRSRLKAASINWNTTVCTNAQTTLSAINPNTKEYDVQRDRWTWVNGVNECSAGIVITDRTGKQYRLLHRCANPVGTMEGLASGYQITPSATITSPPENQVPGQTLTWQHRATNTGSVAANETITYKAQNRGTMGSNDVQSWTAGSIPATGTNYVQQNSTALITQDHVGTSMCRRTSASPAATGNTATVYSADACRLIPYKYELTPTIISTPQAVEPGQNVTGITGSISSSGPTKSYQSDVTYTRIIHKKGQTAPTREVVGVGGLSGCEYYGMNTTQERRDRCTTIKPEAGADNIVFMLGSRAAPAVSDVVPIDFDVGDRICYGITVSGYNDATGAAKSGGRHSALVCVVVGKKPKVHVLGGDLYVGRGSSTSSQVMTSVTRGPVAQPTDTPTIFGSWSEYGIAATGLVTRMGSAAAYAGGVKDANMCNLSLLTLSNRTAVNVCSATSTGHYPLPSAVRTVANKYADQSTTPLPSNSLAPASLNSGLYGVANTNVVTLNGGDLTAGKSVIIYVPNNDVTIAGNLTYTSSRISDVNSIPQLVIIAKNITINENVSQVDAWLVAKATSQGNIYTCNQPATSLTADVCNNPLTVNGPVISNKLHMLRTAGAGSGVAAGSVPAEVFNLRPDAYFWGVSQGSNVTRVPTGDLIELPPRF